MNKIYGIYSLRLKLIIKFQRRSKKNHYSMKLKVILILISIYLSCVSVTLSQAASMKCWLINWTFMQDRAPSHISKHDKLFGTPCYYSGPIASQLVKLWWELVPHFFDWVHIWWVWWLSRENRTISVEVAHSFQSLCKRMPQVVCVWVSRATSYNESPQTKI